jgi:hypothetical protein
VRRTCIGTAMAVLLGLLGLTPVPGAASAAESKPEWGSVSTRDGVLKRSCRDYHYTYEVTAPDEGYWDLEVRVVGPDGRTLFYSYVPEGSPASGTASYRLCRSQTRPGRYKLKPVVTVQDSNQTIQGRLPTERFWLRNRR